MRGPGGPAAAGRWESRWARGFVGSLAALFAVSQWPRRDLITAHWFDWFGLWTLIGVGCVAALIADWVVHASPDGRVRIGSTGSSVPLRLLVNSVAVLTVVSLVVGRCCSGLVLENDDVDLRFAPRDSEVLPLPPTLRLI